MSLRGGALRGGRTSMRGGFRPGGIPLDPFVVLPTFVRTADKAQLDITGDIEVVLRVALTSWASGAGQVLAAKEQTGTSRTFRLHIGSTGLPVFSISTDGSVMTAAAPAVPVGVAAGAAAWVKFTRRQSDGRVQIFTAPNATVEPSAGWSQVGSNVTLSAGSAMFVSTSVLEIGSRIGGGTEVATGRLYRCIVRDGIDGTAVADFDAKVAAGRSSYDDAHGNTWLIG